MTETLVSWLTLLKQESATITIVGTVEDEQEEVIVKDEGGLHWRMAPSRLMKHIINREMANRNLTTPIGFTITSRNDGRMFKWEIRPPTKR